MSMEIVDLPFFDLHKQQELHSASTRITFRRIPHRRIRRVLELPHFLAMLANTTAGAAVSGVDDPVMGTTVHERMELVLVRR